MTTFLRASILIAFALILAACSGMISEPAGPKPSDGYLMSEAMIEMRDGAKLYTTIFTPTGQAGPLPFVMRRSPYSADSNRSVNTINGYMKDLAEDGYIFVFQDIRGRYRSDGEFDMMRPALHGSYHQVVCANKMASKPKKDYTFCGPICENGDQYPEPYHLPELEEGDLLTVLNTGAYGYSMANNYNTQFRPAEVWVDGAKHQLIRKRETLKDITRNMMVHGN